MDLRYELIALCQLCPYLKEVASYIYITLGGTKNVVFTTVLVFSFVALWHDLSFRLLAWGWLVSLFILPELCARYLLPQSKVSGTIVDSTPTAEHRIQYGDRPWYRHVCAIGAVFNILTMMTANLVGFVIGTDGIKYLLSQLLSGLEGKLIFVASLHWLHNNGPIAGVKFMMLACGCLFVGAQIMFEYRQVFRQPPTSLVLRFDFLSLGKRRCDKASIADASRMPVDILYLFASYRRANAP